MGLKDLFGKADGYAYQPGRGGLEPMRHPDGKPVRLSDLSKHQRKSTGQSVKPTKRPKNTDKFWR